VKLKEMAEPEEWRTSPHSDDDIDEGTKHMKDVDEYFEVSHDIEPRRRDRSAM